jgi:hypothetical protein
LLGVAGSFGPGKDVFERDLHTIEVINVPEGHATDVFDADSNPGGIIGLAVVISAGPR